MGSPESGGAGEERLESDYFWRTRIGYMHATKAEVETVLWVRPQAGWRMGEAVASGLVRSMLTNGPIETA